VPTPKSLAEIVEESGHCRATVFKWLRRLESLGLVRKEPVINGRGRPRYFYHPTPKLLNSNGGNLIALPFEELRRACRYHESGFCKLGGQECGASTCDLAKSDVNQGRGYEHA